MSTEDKKAVVGIGSAVVGFFLLFIFMVNLDRNAPGPEQCYEHFVSTYSYGYRLPELDKMIVDDKLTNGECSEINDIYLEAQNRKNLKKHLDKIRKIQKDWRR